MKNKWTDKKGTEFEIDGRVLTWKKKTPLNSVISVKHEIIFRTEWDLSDYMRETGRQIPKEDAE